MTNAPLNLPPLVVCDSCVFIDIVDPDSPYSALVEPIRNDRAQGAVTLGVSELTITEACKLSGKKRPTTDVFALIEEYVAGDNFRRLPVTAPVSAFGAVLVREYHLETCDAIILATALVHKAVRFYTRDNKSLCKKLRSSQTHPAKVKFVPHQQPPEDLDDVPMTTDEKAVFDALESIEVFELKSGTVVEIALPKLE